MKGKNLQISENNNFKAATFEEGREEPQPQEANEGKRESKQLWPILASYYHQQGQSPIQYNWQYKQQFPKSASGGLTSFVVVILDEEF